MAPVEPGGRDFGEWDGHWASLREGHEYRQFRSMVGTGIETFRVGLKRKSHPEIIPGWKFPTKAPIFLTVH
jgi:hypothetical protein